MNNIADDIRGAYDDGFEIGYRMAKKELERHGKWVVVGDTTHYYICSVCGEPGDCFDNYCRNCGSKMKGPEDDDE